MSTVDRLMWPSDPLNAGAEDADSGRFASPARDTQQLRTREIPVMPMPLPTGSIDYNEVLRDLSDRRDELDGAIRAIARIVGHASPPSANGRQHGRTNDSINGVASPAVAAANIRAALDKPST